MNPLVSFYCQCGTPLSAAVGTPTVVCHKCGITMGVPITAAPAAMYPPPPPPEVAGFVGAKRSPTAPILAGIGLVMLLVGVVPRWWFTTGPDRDDGGGVSIGLVEAKACDGGRCETIEYGGLHYGDVSPSFHDYIQFGKWTYWGAIVASLTLAASGVMWFARAKAPVSVGRIAAGLLIAVAVLATIAFATQPKIGGVGKLDLGPGFPLTLVGCVLAAIAGILFGRDDKRAT